MAIHGDLSTVRLPDILQLLNSGQNTGILRIQRADSSIQVTFIRGEIMMAISSREEHRLERFLVQRGHIEADQLSTVDTGIAERGKAFDEFLRSSELLQPDELIAIKQDLSREILYDLFIWTEGSFELEEKSHLDVDQFKDYSPLNIYQIIMEGVRRIDEWQRMKELLHDDRIILDIAGGDEKVLDGLNKVELQVLSLINGQRTIREVCKKSQQSRFDTFHSLHTLLSTGLIMSVGLREDDAEEDCLPETGPSQAATVIQAGKKKPVGVLITVILLCIGAFSSYLFMGGKGQETGEQAAQSSADSISGSNSEIDSASLNSQFGDRVSDTSSSISTEQELSALDSDSPGDTASDDSPSSETSGDQLASPMTSAEGLIDINTAGISDLCTLPRVGSSMAEKIIAYREAHGPFRSPRDLMNVQGIGEKTFEPLSEMITVGTAGRSEPAVARNLDDEEPVSVQDVSSPPAASNDGRININTAGLSKLTELSRIGPKLAERIIAYREKNGPFKKSEDLMKVSGIGVKTFEQLEDRITVGN